jgi:hypothetical protein
MRGFGFGVNDHCKGTNFAPRCAAQDISQQKSAMAFSLMPHVNGKPSEKRCRDEHIPGSFRVKISVSSTSFSAVEESV